MALYKRTLCRRVSTLVNLTPETIYVYSSDGAIIALEPHVADLANLPAIQEEVFYIVDDTQYEAVGVIGRGTRDLVEEYSRGVGRDGIIITSLRLFTDKDVRIYPTGE